MMMAIQRKGESSMKELAHTQSKTYLFIFIVIMGCLSAFGPLTIDMYLPGLPTLASDLGTNASTAQLSLTACLIGLAAGQLIVGPYSDMVGRKKPLIVALILFTISSVLCMFTGSIWGLIVLRFIQGLTGAAGMVISRAGMRDRFSGQELTKYFAMLMLVNGLAPIAAPVAGGQLLQFMSWRGIFGVLALIGGIMLLAVCFGLSETLPKERRKTGGISSVFNTFGRLIRNRVFMGYVLVQGFAMSAMFAYISGSTFVLQDIYGLSPQMFSLIFALNGLGLIIATQATGKLAPVFGETSLLRYGILQGLSASVLLIVSISLEASVVFICIFLFLTVSTVGIVNTTVFSLAMSDQGDNAGSAAALLGLLPFILGGAAAPLVGLGDGASAVPMAVVIAICEAVAVVSYFIMVRKKG